MNLEAVEKLENLGDFFLKKGDMGRAVDYFSLAINHYEDHGNVNIIRKAELYQKLGDLFYEEYNFWESIKYYESCYKICRLTQDKDLDPHSISDILKAYSLIKKINSNRQICYEKLCYDLIFKKNDLLFSEFLSYCDKELIYRIVEGYKVDNVNQLSKFKKLRFEIEEFDKKSNETINQFTKTSDLLGDILPQNQYDFRISNLNQDEFEDESIKHNGHDIDKNLENREIVNKYLNDAKKFVKDDDYSHAIKAAKNVIKIDDRNIDAHRIMYYSIIQSYSINDYSKAVKDIFFDNYNINRLQILNNLISEKCYNLYKIDNFYREINHFKSSQSDKILEDQESMPSRSFELTEYKKLVGKEVFDRSLS